MKMVVNLTKVAGVNLSTIFKLAVKTTEYAAPCMRENGEYNMYRI